jgi:hypothetical protein
MGMETELTALETIQTPEPGALDRVESLHIENMEKAAGLAPSPEAKERALGKLTNLRNAAITALFLNGIGGTALAQEVETAPDVAPVAVEKTVALPEEAKAPPVTPEQATGITDMLIEAAQNKIQQKIDSKKESLSTLGDEKKEIGEKVDAGIDVVHTIPAVARKIPLLSLVENLRGIQRDIEEKKSPAEIMGRLLRAAISAKTFGLSDFIYNRIKGAENTKKETAQPERTVEEIAADMEREYQNSKSIQ